MVLQSICVWGTTVYADLRRHDHILCHFYLSIVYNPDDVADNVRKQGGFMPGIRPGKRTADYLDDVLTKITWVGGFYLALVALIPELMLAGLRLNHLPGWMGAGGFDSHLPT